jgi:hypothetical protein
MTSITLFVIISLLSALSVSLIYACVNLLRKLEAYEDFIDTELKKNETLLETLRKLDSRQMFEKDDEVGTLFKQIKDTIIRLKQF